MKLTLVCFILIWSVQVEVGNTLKCYECQTRKGFGPFSICPEPEEFQDTAPLVECNRKRGASFCIKSEGGKKLVFLSVSLFKKDILAFVWIYYFVQENLKLVVRTKVLKKWRETGRNISKKNPKWMDVLKLLMVTQFVFATRMVAIQKPNFLVT